jgi:ATP-binding cassette subfamily B protein
MKGGGTYPDLVLFRRLAREARPYRLHIAAIFLISMLAAPLTLLTPVPLQIAVDSVIGSHPPPGFLDGVLPSAVTSSKDGVLIFAACMFLAVAVLTQVQDLGNTILKTYTGEKLVLNFRSRLFQQSQRLSLAYHDRVGTSDSTYRVQEDARALQYIAVESLISLITATTTLAAMIYVTARIDFQLALVALAVSPLLLLAATHFRPRMRAQSRDVKKLESGALSVVQEVLTGLRVVKAFGQEDREQERFVGRSSAGMRARIRLSLTEGAYALLVGAAIGVGSSVVLFVGIRHVQQGTITLGELLLVMGYLSQLYTPIRMMARKAGSLQTHLASAERAFALLDQVPDVPERPDAQPIARASGGVEFRDVSFAYGRDRLALDSISFAVEPGMRVGIAGATGAGKTTMMNLLTRFYDPIAGQILLDGVDLRDYKLADLRNQFGIVLQEPVLFSTSIAENIAYARPDAGQREIEASAAAANVHDFIVSLPEGYDTPVGERGMRLSGGERQRISLARAFLKDAQILIMDEPTSSVDLETEALILEAMERLMAGRTSFMIAHRVSTLDGCDVRLEVDEGRIVTVTAPPGEPPTRQLSPVRARVRAAVTPTARAPQARQISHPALNGRIETAKVATELGWLSDHPAVAAWLSLGGAKPQQVRDLKEGKRFRKSAIYRLEGAGPDRSPVIAKLCNRKTAEIESNLYAKLLPRLRLPSLHCYGKVREGDTDYCWLFLEDAGAERYSPLEPEHRRLVARWLATVQLHATEVLAASDLPDRGPRHYLVHLLNAREEIGRQLRRREAEADGGLILGDLLCKLDVLETYWRELTAFCDALPQTLVHGDLVPKNLRITRNGAGVGLAIFDWETAGLGPQAPDLAQLLESERSEVGLMHRSKRFHRFSANPCLDTYRSVLAASATELEPETIELSAAVGSLFRCLAGIDWTCSQATTAWCPVDDFRIYSGWLSNAMRVAGWGSPGR